MQFKSILNYNSFGYDNLIALLKSNNLKIKNEAEVFKLLYNIAEQMNKNN